MKALSVRQPWASLLIAGVKDVENRTWTTEHRGILAIHAAKAVTREGLEEFRHLLDGEPPRGVVLGTVQLVGIVKDSDSDWADDDPDVWHWLVRDPVAFPGPIEAKGRLGLWEWDRRKGR